MDDAIHTHTPSQAAHRLIGIGNGVTAGPFTRRPSIPCPFSNAIKIRYASKTIYIIFHVFVVVVI